MTWATKTDRAPAVRLWAACLLACCASNCAGAAEKDSVNALLDKAEREASPSALKLYKRVLQQDPKNCVAYVNAGQIYAQMGKQEALDHFVKAGEVCTGQNSALAFHNAGQYHWRSGGARHSVHASRRSASDRCFSSVRAGYASQMFGRMADAEEYFGKAIRINPLSRESYVKLAYVKNTLGKV